LYDAPLPHRRPPRILIVEPRQGSAEIIAEVLSTIGCEIVGPFSSLHEASAVLGQDERIDGAVLEMNVGGSFSFELAIILRERGKAIIFFTRCGAYLLPALLRSAVVLPKPTGIELLAEAARAAFFKA
jgi:DNA-binding LytR/AlgR family response regulator